MDNQWKLDKELVDVICTLLNQGTKRLPAVHHQSATHQVNPKWTPKKTTKSYESLYCFGADQQHNNQPYRRLRQLANTVQLRSQVPRK
ncbi:hypothetical protein M514_00500 [Trichuris suis]|uniref:Uncharacterized protein n=1 Tax=Trichuris suis TaxID=68888 RepID=A0A085NRK1_9BILA|nr:hypothetical protein M513_00500 [Trichuris suis]KFD72097.1 hypothetical protein M514_00500 [Trichuris suis]